MVKRQKEDLGICQAFWETGWEEVRRENRVYTRNMGREGLGMGHRHHDGDSSRARRAKRQESLLKASLHPPGSFEVAFPDAAEKMRNVIIHLKEGKIDSISFPQP